MSGTPSPHDEHVATRPTRRRCFPAKSTLVAAFSPRRTVPDGGSGCIALALLRPSDTSKTSPELILGTSPVIDISIPVLILF